MRWILIQLRPSGCRNRIHIQLPGCLPGRSPADHPDEVVVDIVPLYTRPATGRETLSEAGFGFTAHLTVWPNSTLALALPIWPVPRFGTRKSPPPVLGARNSPLPPPSTWYQKLSSPSTWYQRLPSHYLVPENHPSHGTRNSPLQCLVPETHRPWNPSISTGLAV